MEWTPDNRDTLDYVESCPRCKSTKIKNGRCQQCGCRVSWDV